ncbi:MAG TPA: hypothetical protein VGK96_05545 [Candidatus Sulfotelmatobacter sp.]|jgi:hypothetical protein
MRIWKLTPTNLTDPMWTNWSPEPIIFRAESETEARHLAHLEAASSVRIPGPPNNIINPWSRYKFLGDPAPLPTRCEDITEQTTEYSVDGPAQVLPDGEKGLK